MNKVDVETLRTLVDRLEELLDTYQDNYINLYNEIQDSEMFWHDPHAVNFFRQRVTEKARIDVSYNELTSTKKVYDLVIRNYEKIGEYIEFNIQNRSSLLSKFNTYINKLNRVYNNYCDMDYSFANSSIQLSIEYQKDKVRELLDEATDLRDNIRKLLSDISENERKIRREISKINVKVLPQPSIEGVISA